MSATWTREVEALRAVLLRGLRALLPDEGRRLLAVTVIAGAVCGLLAVGFHLAIDRVSTLLIDRALDPRVRGWWALTVLCPTAGGLVAGALLQRVFPGARGSGIPQVKEAVALHAGRVRVRDAVGKFVLTTLQVGTGASLGREGPTVQICAGATTLLARLAALPPRHMRRLTPVGVAAGIAAAFNTPVAAVTFTIEEIVGSLDHSVLSGAVVAAAIAAIIERSILGTHPILPTDATYGLDDPRALLFYALLGVAAAAVSVLFTDALLAVRARFRRRPSWAHPAVGGLITGALAVVAMATVGLTGITGGGYASMTRALAGTLPLRALAVLGGLKLVATVASYASGGAGGVFAPTLFLGAMLGGVVGALDTAAFGHHAMGAFALVGMGAMFAGVIRAPITSVLIIVEMTGSHGMVLPLMIANAIAYGLARRARPVPLYEALLAQDGVHLPDVPTRPHALEVLTVRDAMTADVVVARVDESVAAVRERARGGRFTALPVIDARGGLVGEVLVAALDGDGGIAARVQGVERIERDEPLLRAVVRMTDLGRRHLVVVGDDGRRVVGMLSITDLVRAHARGAVTATRMPATAETLADVAWEAPVVDGRARVDDILERLEGANGEAVLVRGEGGALDGVIVLGHLRELLRDRALQRMLVASDIARPLPSLPPDAPLADVCLRFARSNVDAVRLDDATPRLATRAAVADALLRSVAMPATKPERADT